MKSLKEKLQDKIQNEYEMINNDLKKEPPLRILEKSEYYMFIERVYDDIMDELDYIPDDTCQFLFNKENLLKSLALKLVADDKLADTLDYEIHLHVLSLMNL